MAAGQGSPARSWAAEPLTIERVDVGLGGRYKSGYWTPVRVELAGPKPTQPVSLEFVAPDSEGMSVTYVVDQAVVPVATESGGWRCAGYVKFAGARSGLTVRVRSGQELLAERRFRDGELPAALAVHQPLLVTLRQSVAIDEAARQVFTADTSAVDAVVADPRDLPERWFGYEGVYALVIGTSDLAWIDRLSPRQLRAIDEWLRLGGRLVLSAGGKAVELQKRGAPWAGWLPGQVEDIVELRKAAGLESYAAAEQRLLDPDGEGRLALALLPNVVGRIEAQETLAGKGERPVVVTFPVGFGRVMFVAVDIDKQPVANWSGRPRFLAKVLQTDRSLHTDVASRESQGQVSHLGFDDLSGQLRSALDQFPGVKTIAFGWIVTLVIGYIALLGPIDYFLHRRLGRPEATWITFPLAALGCAALAIWLGGRSKEVRLRVNQVDVVDVDAASQLVRGTTWCNIYSPTSVSAEWRFDTVAPQRPPLGTAPREFVASWQGVPGRGVGALGGGATTLLASGSYTIHVPPAPDDTAAGAPAGYLESLPIAVAGTRCLAGRWQGPAHLSIDAQLRSDSLDGQLQGRFRNPWDFRLTDWALVRGNWMYRAQRELEPGDEVSIAEFAGARYLDWHLTRRRVGADAKDFTVPWDDTSFDVPRIVEMMLFHGSAGGSSYTQIAGRYQQYLDLTDHLRLGQAVLVGKGPAACLPSRDRQPVATNYDQQVAFYRILLPVELSPSAPKR